MARQEALETKRREVLEKKMAGHTSRAAIITMLPERAYRCSRFGFFQGDANPYCQGCDDGFKCHLK